MSGERQTYSRMSAPGSSTAGKRHSVAEINREIRNDALDSQLGKHDGDAASVFDQAGDCSMESFSTILYKISPVFWSAMVIGGFCAPGSGKIAVNLYLMVWVVAFIMCFLTCFTNCFIQDPPFHVMWADMMVALVHVPGFYSVIFWRRLLDDPSSPAWRLITRAHGTENALTWFCKCMAPFLFPAQVAVVGLVWAGYAWPIELYLQDSPDDFSANFHAKSMWIVIPPVVANVVANAAFFAFFCYAHYLQVDQVLLQMGAIYEEADDSGGELTRMETSQWGPKAGDDEEAMDIIISNVFAVQDELDDSCHAWSGLVTLFLIWALGAIVAVMFDFIAFLSGSAKFEWTVWVLLIDLFLGVAGLMMVIGFLVMGAVLTQRMDELCIESIECMRAKQVPISKAAASYTYIQTGGRKTGLGFKIFNIRIDWSYVATFASVVVTSLGLVLTTVAPADDTAITTHAHARASFHMRRR